MNKEAVINNRIKAILVDDLVLDRENLRLQLKMIRNVEIVGEAGNIDDARRLIFKYRPDIVFLDIKLPEKNGFELLDELKDKEDIQLDVIFITAYPQFASKAFKYYPFTFLEKPVERKQLKNVIEKYNKEKCTKNFSQRVDEFNKIKRQLHFKTEEGHIWIEPSNILWCKASRNDTEIYLTDGSKETVSVNISNIENILPEDNFYRTHRSYIVNIYKIRKLTRRNGKINIFNNPFNEFPYVAKNRINELVKLIEDKLPD